MKTLLSLIGIIIVIALAVFAYNAYSPGAEPGQETREGFVRYSNDELGFSILRPEESTVHQEGVSGEIIKFRLLGPAAEPNTDITDGFTFTVRESTSTSTQNLRSLAEAELIEAMSHAAQANSSLEAIEINGMSAYRYSYETLLGPTAVDHIFLENGTGYIATYIIQDPGNRGYEQMIHTMLDSLTFN
jgi:hypothetical protein